MSHFLRQFIVGIVMMSVFTQTLAQPVFAITQCERTILSADQMLEMIRNEKVTYRTRLDTYPSQKYFDFVSRNIDAEILQKCKATTTCTQQEVFNVSKSILDRLFSNASAVDSVVRKLKSTTILISLIVAGTWAESEVSKRIEDPDSIFANHEWVKTFLTIVISFGAVAALKGPLIEINQAIVRNKSYGIKAGKLGSAPMSAQTKKDLVRTYDLMNAGLNDIERTASTMIYFFGSGAAGAFRQLKPLTNDAAVLQLELEKLVAPLARNQEHTLPATEIATIELQKTELLKKIETNDTESSSIFAELAFTARNSYSYIQPELKQIEFYIDNVYEPQLRPLSARQRLLDVTIDRLKTKDREFKTNSEHEKFYRNLMSTWLQIP